MHRQVMSTLLLQVQKIAKDVMVSSVKKSTDHDVRWSEAGVRAIQHEGLDGMITPITYGGLGRGLTALVRVREEPEHDCASSTICCFDMQCVGASGVAVNTKLDQEMRFLAGTSEEFPFMTPVPNMTGISLFLPAANDAGDPKEVSLTGNRVFLTKAYATHACTAQLIAHRGSAVRLDRSRPVWPTSTVGLSE